MAFTRASLLAALALSLPLQVAAQSNNRACRRAAEQQEEGIESLDLRFNAVIYAPFDAADAYDCITSIPLDTEEAAEMLNVIRSYLVFQTTLPYNADAPDSYQQPEIDVESKLNELERRMDNGDFSTLYDFDLALRAIVVGVYDGHYSLDTGVLGLFSWMLPDTIVSVSSDGQEIPEIYALSDILEEKEDVSPIVEFEGEPVFEYLESYVNRSNLGGYIEPHALYNQLNWSPPQNFVNRFSYGSLITPSPNNFQMTRVYNGESLSGRFANGSEFEWPYAGVSMTTLAALNLTSAAEIMNEYVRQSTSGSIWGSLVGRSEDGRFRQMQSTFPLTELRNDVPGKAPVRDARLRQRQIYTGDDDDIDEDEIRRLVGYPDDPIVTQRYFGAAGWVSGYILEDISVGVLSLPSFLTSGGDRTTPGSSIAFSEAVREFIREAKDANVGKIIIDLSGNVGGVVFQGIDTFKLFFPDAEPPVAVRGAASPTHNVLGRLMTGIIENEGGRFSDDVSLIAEQLGSFIPLVSAYSTNTDGEPWESYADFFGPVEANGANFTNVARYDLSSEAVAIPMGQNISGYGDNTINYEQPWSGEDIILLLDGTCASTCALFSDLMKTHAGVRSVAVGGVPQNGPMQGVSGTRGSNTIPYAGLDLMIQSIAGLALEEERAFATLLRNEDISLQDLNTLPQPLALAPWAIRSGQVNVLDIVRPESEDPDVSYQFIYEASNCRIFQTAETIRNISALWHVVGEYANGDDSVCVPESTDGFGTAPNETFVDDPGFSGEDIWENANSTEVPDNGNAPETGNGSNGSGGNGGDGNDDGDDDEGAAAHMSASFGGLVLALAFGMMISC